MFGIDRYRDLFTPRQLLVLATISDAIREAHSEMLADGMEQERARAVTTYLGLLMDRIADYNSSFCSWDLSREKIMNPTFVRQSIADDLGFHGDRPFR